MGKLKKKEVGGKLSNKLVGVNYSISCANKAKNVVNVQFLIFERL